MEKTLVVSLVSRQTVPNVQFAKWYRESHPDLRADLIFISTAEMEKCNKSDIIRATLHISDFHYESYGTLEVYENSLVDIREKLTETFLSPNSGLDLRSYGKIVLNMTGGTKIMSLASFLFFKDFSNAEIYYQTFENKVFQVFPEEKESSVSVSISIEEFLMANDIAAEETGEFMKDYEFNRNFFEQCLCMNAGGLKVLSKLGDAKNADGTFSLVKMNYFGRYGNEVSKAINIAKYCHFNPERITGAQESFMKGVWFEEYVCQSIMKKFGISKDRIALNMKIERGNDSNELDVVYVSDDNTLHIVECKALVQNENPSRVINDALYKLKSLTTKFGLKVKGHIYTKATKIDMAYIDRAKEFNIEIVYGTSI